MCVEKRGRHRCSKTDNEMGGKKIEFNRVRCIKELYLVVVKEHGTLEPSLDSTPRMNGQGSP